MPKRRIGIASAWIVAMLGLATPAQACRTHAETVLGDVRYADVVVVGRIANYRIVKDEQIRRQRRELLARPDLPPDIRRLYENQTSFMSDYARFTIHVDQVVKGRASPSLTVTWDNSTFGEPATLPGGRYLIALRKPTSRIPPLRGPSATILPSPEPNSMSVLQAPCASPFLFLETSREARNIRRILRT